MLGVTGSLHNRLDDHMTFVTIPFRYFFVCRFGECYTVISAFSRKYYDYFPIQKGETVVDVGAHVGTFAIRVAKKVGKSGHIIAIEPEPVTYSILDKNIRFNKLTNVFALNYACDIKSGYTKLFNNGYTGSSICFPSSRYIEVKTINLTKLMTTLRIKRIDYLKINAEGAELKILNGLSCWEKVSKVAIAAHHYAEEAEEIQNFLRRVGFKTLIVHLKNNTLVYAKR